MVVEERSPASNIDQVNTEQARRVDEAFEVAEPVQDPRIAPRIIPLIVTFLIAALIIVVLFVLPR
jgi:hypothetical protein